MDTTSSNHRELADLITQHEELGRGIRNKAEDLRASCKHERVLWEGGSQRFPNVRYCTQCGTYERHPGLPFGVITTEWGKETKDHYSDPDRFIGPLVEYKTCGGCHESTRFSALTNDWHR